MRVIKYNIIRLSIGSANRLLSPRLKVKNTARAICDDNWRNRKITDGARIGFGILKRSVEGTAGKGRVRTPKANRGPNRKIFDDGYRNRAVGEK